MKSIFEEMGGAYTLGADGMYDPNLVLPEEEPHTASTAECVCVIRKNTARCCTTHFCWPAN